MGPKELYRIKIEPFGTSRDFPLEFCSLTSHSLAGTDLLAAMLVAKRLVADPATSIGDLMKAFEKFLEDENDLDLLEKVSCPGHHSWSWKTAPHPGWIYKLCGLALLLVHIAPNGVLQSTKLKAAVQKICQKKKINKSRYHDCDFADHVDQRVRIVLAQLRLLKQKSDEYHKCMRKASPDEKAGIDKVLSYMVLDVGPTTTVSSTELSMVPYTMSAPAPNVHASSSTSIALPPTSGDSANIFKRVLSKKDSSPLPPKRSPIGKFTRSFAKSFSGMFVPPEDSSSVSDNAPAPKRKNKSSASKSTGRKRRVSSSPDMGLEEDEKKILQEVLEAEVSKEKTKRTRRTKKKPSTVADQQKKEKTDQKKTSSSKNDSGQKKGEEKAVRKSSWRRRKTSSAYHSAMKQALKEGKSPTTCRTLARAAHSRMGSDIDSGLVKEEN